MEEFYKTIVELHSKGMTDKEIGLAIGYSHSYVRKVRKFILGLENLRDLKAKKMLKLIPELHSKGISDSEIARLLGESSSSIQHYRKNLLKLSTHFEEKTYDSEEERIKGYMIRNIKSSAKRRGIVFDLHYTDLTLPKYCPLLGLELKYRGEVEFNSIDRATVDRIDNTKGYVEGNVWIISRLANSMKNEATLEQLETFANNVYKLLENQRARGGVTVS